MIETPETLRWRSREVRYYAGAWDDVLSVLPDFETVPFRAGPEEPPNPFLLTVCRKPRCPGERPVPVGVVSEQYSLVQHREAATRCRDGLVDAGVRAKDLRYEVGVSQLDEWMNFRVYFPEDHGRRDSLGERVDLRLECFNSVNGWSRLMVLFGWYRFVCSNGMVIGESMIEIRERHGQPLEIDTIPERIASSLEAVEADRRRLHDWEKTPIDVKDDLARWIDGPVSTRWGKRAAARVFHICVSGRDVEIEKFTAGEASVKPVRFRCRVPGSAIPARTKYHVAQALSFVATQRNDPDDRVGRQAAIPDLLRHLTPRGEPVRQQVLIGGLAE
ncbi:MAG: DUF932 domain-containing protein [Acidobacteria bacterium]|nr:DUF932 domain-containing protein [Acidobacteriota bacterium]